MQILSLARESEVSLRAYKHEVQASYLQIEKYQKVVEDKGTLITEYNAIFLKIEGYLLDKGEK